MSVHVTLLGRLGNHLFQYALGRILAEELGLALECHARPLGPLASTLALPAHASLTALAADFPHAPLHLAGRSFSAPVQNVTFERGGPGGENTFDFPAVLADRSDRQIRLAGYFQRYEYYQPYQERIRQWLRQEDRPVAVRPRANDVLVNFRRGNDFGRLHWTLGLDYYHRVLRDLDARGQVYLCGTGIDRQVLEALAPYAPRVIEAAPTEHFRIFRAFDRVVLSNSTFAWWASYLSGARELHAPRTTPGSGVFAFTGFDDVDLHMRESRYREVETGPPARFEAFYRNALAGSPPGAVAFFRDRIPGLVPAGMDRRSWSDHLDWLGRQGAEIPDAELRARLQGPDQQRTLAWLTAEKILVPDGRYPREI